MHELRKQSVKMVTTSLSAATPEVHVFYYVFSVYLQGDLGSYMQCTIACSSGMHTAQSRLHTHQLDLATEAQTRANCWDACIDPSEGSNRQRERYPSEGSESSCPRCYLHSPGPSLAGEYRSATEVCHRAIQTKRHFEYRLCGPLLCHHWSKCQNLLDRSKTTNPLFKAIWENNTGISCVWTTVLNSLR